MKKIAFILSCIFTIVLSSPAFSEEIYALLVSDAKSSVYRVVTSDEPSYPIGYFFDCNKAQKLYIDSLKNFRLYSTSGKNQFFPTKRKLARQVFDGKAYISNFGLKTQLLQDQRDLIVPQSLVSPVYRPKGGFCGISNGKIIHSNKVSAIDKEQQSISYKNKNWSEISNNSWFQTWQTHKCKNKLNKTYLVFFDREEKKQQNCVEEFWRGEQPALAFSREIGKHNTYQLLRGKVSGALEIVNNNKKLQQIWQQKDLFSICLFPDNLKNNKYSTYFYRWSGSQKGELFENGKTNNTQPILESTNEKYRAIGIGYGDLGIKYFYVIGTDILRNWLQTLKPNLYKKQINADIIKFELPLNSFGINVYIYSDAEGKLFKFFVNNAKAISVEEFNLPKNIQDFCIGKKGHLYYAILDDSRDRELEISDFNDNRDRELEISDFNDNTNILMPEPEPENEKIKVANVFNKVSNVAGKMIFSQSYYENIYRFNISNNYSKLMYSIFLHKKYFSQSFTVKKTTTELFAIPGARLVSFLRENGAILSKISGNVKGFPDQYQKPNKVILSAFQPRVY